MANDKQLDHLIGVLYETVLEPGRWCEAMALCAEFVGSLGAHMLTIDKKLNLPVFSTYGGEILTDENASDYVGYYMAIDPRVTSNMMDDAKVSEWRTCHSYFSKQFVNHNEFYQDFLLPRGSRYSMGAWVDDGADQHTLMGLHRSVKHSPFGDAERLAAQQFSPHLQRALRLQAHTQQLQAKADLGASAIDALALAMFIVDPKGVILHLNAGAESLLGDKASGLISGGGVISTTQASDKTKLAALITGATSNPAVGGALCLGTENPKQLFVTPLSAASAFSRDWQKPLALILVMEVGKSLSPLSLLAQLYNLSPAELRIAAALLAGKSPEEYCQEAGVTLNTVRTQLKSLFRKTDTHRQAELVLVLSRVPALKIDYDADL